MLCKACHEPVTNHVSYMKRHEEKKAKQAVDYWEYEEFRVKMLDLALNEIDAPDIPDDLE
jgi:hypothetical protein